MVNTNMDALEWLRKQLDGDGDVLFREMVREFAQRLMPAEVDALNGASWGEVSRARVNQRNGYRARPFDTRVGSIELAIPKLRRGRYFPDGLHDAVPLVAVVSECYARRVGRHPSLHGRRRPHQGTTSRHQRRWRGGERTSRP